MIRPLLGTAVALTTAALAVTSAAGASGIRAEGVPPERAATGLALNESFNAPFTGTMSPSGLLRINGDWPGTGGNTILRSNATVGGGLLRFRANATTSAEVQTVPERLFHAGCYSTRMKTARPAGVVSSFFFISDAYAAPEVDVEILSKDRRSTSGKVWLTAHLGDGTQRQAVVPVAFDPSAGFHTYSFALTSTTVTWWIDGVRVKRFTGLPANLGGAGPIGGYVMANEWSGAYEWVGLPPTRDALTAYDWMRGREGVTTCA